MDIFDRLHRFGFDRLFPHTEDGRQAKARMLREAGFPANIITDLCRPGVQAGMTFGPARPVDVMTVVEQVLLQQNAGSVLLRVSRPPHDKEGHVEIAVLEVSPPAEQVEGEQASREFGPTP